MKKIYLVALCAMFCLGSAAQSNVENDDETTAVADSSIVGPESGDEPRVNRAENAQLAEISALLAQIKQLTLNGNGDKPDSEPVDIFKPVCGRSKFTRRHYIYQTLDISPTISTDHDPNLPETTSNGKEIDDSQIASFTGFGLNFGYSLIFVPGRIEGEQLRLNRMGFAYNIGIVASFSKQDKYGTTGSFLLKLGAEMGNGHFLGIGYDILGGYGKSTGDMYSIIYEENDDDDLADPYTEWCWQYGMQIWLRTDLLKTAISNTEMLMFARFIRSVNPEKIEGDSQKVNDKLAYDNYWKDEVWSFGIMFRYKF